MQQRRAAAIGVVAAAILGCAACGSSGKTTVGTTSTVAPTTSTTGATTTTSPSTATTTTTVGGSPVGCQTANLTITLGSAKSGLSHYGQTIVFRNNGPRCVLHGYPGLDGDNASGGTVLSAERTLSGYLGGLGAGVAEPTVVLATGDSASALYEGEAPGVPGVACPAYTVLAITPPNETHTVKLPSPQTICGLQIHPVVPGTSGDDPHP